MRIIFDINLFFLREVEQKFPNNRDRLRRMSIIEEGSVQMVRMAYLAVVGSHTVNGVAKIHSGLVRTEVREEYTYVLLCANMFVCSCLATLSSSLVSTSLPTSRTASLPVGTPFFVILCIIFGLFWPILSSFCLIFASFCLIFASFLLIFFTFTDKN